MLVHAATSGVGIAAVQMAALLGASGRLGPHGGDRSRRAGPEADLERVYPSGTVETALQDLAKNDHVGKLVVRGPD